MPMRPQPSTETIGNQEILGERDNSVPSESTPIDYSILSVYSLKDTYK